MKHKEIKDAKIEKLYSMQTEFSSEIMRLNLLKFSGNLKQTHSISERKKNLARVKTEINNRKRVTSGGSNA